jgi:CDP-paratose 2-epimerase
MMMREGGFTLVTGGAGFIGSNLADALLSDGEPVVILDDLSRPGVVSNLEWLLSRHGSSLRVEVGDIRNAALVSSLVGGAKRVYHLAAQVAVTTSLRNPRQDLECNLLGTFNVLEAVREMAQPPPVLFTSTNKVYGDLAGVPVRKDGDRYDYLDGRPGTSENVGLDFLSPYGCSKGAADQYVRDYSRIFGVPTVVFRMSCVYGTRQFGTEDQGWVAHFARALMAGSPITIFGDGCQVRDLLWVGDLVQGMRLALDRVDEVAGEAFNIGGGAENAVAVREVLDRLMDITGRRVPVELAEWRPGDQRIYVSDTRKARTRLGWRPRVGWAEGLERLVDWLEEADICADTVHLGGTDRSEPARAAL